jgi:hypothetical protein
LSKEFAAEIRKRYYEFYKKIEEENPEQIIIFPDPDELICDVCNASLECGMAIGTNISDIEILCKDCVKRRVKSYIKYTREDNIEAVFLGNGILFIIANMEGYANRNLYGIFSNIEQWKSYAENCYLNLYTIEELKERNIDTFIDELWNTLVEHPKPVEIRPIKVRPKTNFKVLPLIPATRKRLEDISNKLWEIIPPNMDENSIEAAKKEFIKNLIDWKERNPQSPLRISHLAIFYWYYLSVKCVTSISIQDFKKLLEESGITFKVLDVFDWLEIAKEIFGSARCAIGKRITHYTIMWKRKYPEYFSAIPEKVIISLMNYIESQLSGRNPESFAAALLYILAKYYKTPISAIRIEELLGVFRSSLGTAILEIISYIPGSKITNTPSAFGTKIEFEIDLSEFEK